MTHTQNRNLTTGRNGRRYAASVFFSVATTAGLLLIMQYAIRQNEPTSIATHMGPLVTLVPLEDEEIKTKERKPAEPPPPPEPAPISTLKFTPEPVEGDWGVVSVPEPTTQVLVGVADADADMLPIMTMAAVYPDRAASQGIQGWVLLEFTVDQLGRVVEPRVLQAQPQTIFDRAALTAVKRYKYKPRVVNGQPVPVTGVRQRIIFELTQA